MPGKKERTRQFILERAAPLFTRQGYVGTSMSAITDATGLTKGAVYGNFDNKENLAVEAFNFTVRKILWKMADIINAESSALKKLQALTDYFRDYYDDQVLKWGGCPIVSVGVDARALNPVLFERVKRVIQKLKGSTSDIIREGIEAGEIRSGINPDQYGSRIFSLIMGGIFSATTLSSPEMLDDMLDHIDILVATELKL